MKSYKMSTNPLVSIITPSYNKGQFIEETIQSVLSQTYHNIEYIIIDGKSTDNTEQILKKYPGIDWISEPDKGQTDAINKGMRRAKGEILAYLNADDTYLPDTVETVVNIFQAQSDISIVYGDIIHTDENSGVINTHKTGVINLEKCITHRFYLPQPTVFFTRGIWEKTGPFDESLHLAMDFDYWLRIFPVYQSQYIPKPLATTRIYPGAKSTEMNYKYIEDRVQVLNNFYKNSKNLSKYNNLQKKAYSFAHFLGAHDYFRIRKWDPGLYHLKKSLLLYPPIIITTDFYKTTGGTILRLTGIIKGCLVPD